MQGDSPRTGFTPFQGLYQQQLTLLVKPHSTRLSGQNYAGRCPFTAGYASERLENHEGFRRRPSCSSRKWAAQNGSH
jgi:hypothetical protein